MRVRGKGHAVLGGDQQVFPTAVAVIALAYVAALADADFEDLYGFGPVPFHPEVPEAVPSREAARRVSSVCATLHRLEILNRCLSDCNR